MRPLPLHRLFARRLLTASTIRYGAAGWPVAPGAWWDGQHYTCPAPACRRTGLHPAGDPAGGHPTHLRSSTDPAQVRAWWAGHPHTILLPTGDALDVVEAPAQLAAPVWRRLYARGVLVPTASLPGGRWLLFTTPTPAGYSAEELPGSVVHHGAGSYVPAPPSALRHGPVRWEHAPWVSAWRLPEAQVVLDALAAQQRRGSPRPATSIHWT